MTLFFNRSGRCRGFLAFFCLFSLFPCWNVAFSPTSFHDWSYDKIVDRLQQWAIQFPHLVRLEKASDIYGIKYPVNVKCSEKHGVCDHYIVTVTNHNTWTKWLSSNPSDSTTFGLGNEWTDNGTRIVSTRPHIFLSGALHGNERVGPTAVTVALDYLLANYEDSHSKAHAWAKRMLDTRVVIAVPMTNADGYSHNKREEMGIDSNRDFPYHLTDTRGKGQGKSDQCMRTLAARVVNEIFRAHLIQLSMTFHGGMRAISYEWGGPNHGVPRDKSPDHSAQYGMAEVMRFVGGTKPQKQYPTGSNQLAAAFNNWFFPIETLNKLVYPVRGGMEDWAYAGSWEKDDSGRQVSGQCVPTTYGGYPESKTEYSPSMLRSFNFLIEASDNKIPNNGWGSMRYGFEDIWRINEEGIDGHVPRNARLALYTISMAQPYVVLHSAKITTVQKANVGSDDASQKVQLQVNASVGGCNTVDSWKIEAQFLGTNAEISDSNSRVWVEVSNSGAANVKSNMALPMPLARLLIDEGMWQTLANDSFKLTMPLRIDATLESRQLLEEMLRYTLDLELDGGSESVAMAVRLSVSCDGNWWRNSLSQNVMNLEAKEEVVESWPKSATQPQSHVVNARSRNGPAQYLMTNGHFMVWPQTHWHSHEFAKVSVDPNSGSLTGGELELYTSGETDVVTLVAANGGFGTDEKARSSVGGMETEVFEDSSRHPTSSSLRVATDKWAADSLSWILSSEVIAISAVFGLFVGYCFFCRVKRRLGGSSTKFRGRAASGRRPKALPFVSNV